MGCDLVRFFDDSDDRDPPPPPDLSFAAAPETVRALDRTGDGYLARHTDMRSVVPQVGALIAGGERAAEAVLDRFTGTPDFSREAELVVYAYALGEMRYTKARRRLARFLGANLAGDLYLAPQAVTHTLLLLEGGAEIDTATLFYPGVEMEAVIARNTAGGGALTAAKDAVSCQRRYLMRDSAGEFITYQDADGSVVPVAVECTEYRDIRVGPVAMRNGNEEVASGGGIRVREFDGGVPNRRFNCAGFAFRELNRNGGWNCSAADLHRAFTRSGLLQAKPVAEARAGDKVFYSAEGGVRHVAVVHRVDADGVWVRNADNQSGIFDAKIDAAYFKTRKFTAQVYEWRQDNLPTLEASDGISTQNQYCDPADPPRLPKPYPPDEAPRPMIDAGMAGEVDASHEIDAGAVPDAGASPDATAVDEPRDYSIIYAGMRFNGYMYVGEAHVRDRQVRDRWHCERCTREAADAMLETHRTECSSQCKNGASDLCPAEVPHHFYQIGLGTWHECSACAGMHVEPGLAVGEYGDWSEHRQCGGS